MGTPTYRATISSQQFDAFYRDEWGPINTAANTSADVDDRKGFHKNRFTLVSATRGSVVEAEGGWTLSAENRVAPKDATTVKLVPSAGLLAQARSRLRGGSWAGDVSVTLFFGVGNEVNRHGLRSFVERAPGLHMVIHVLCNETDPPFHPRIIDDGQIDDLLKDALRGSVPWKLRVIAGYSFGSAGVNTLVLGRFVDLANVRRLVFYDCLYRFQFGSTASAIQLVKRIAGGDLRTVVYKTSGRPNAPGGNTLLDGDRLAVVVENPGLIDRRGVVENLFHSQSFQALCVFRSLQGAVDDGVVTLPAPLQKLHDAMVVATATLSRGSVISNRTTWTYVRGAIPPGNTVFADWAAEKSNAAALAAYGSKLSAASRKDSLRGILWQNRIPGWWRGDFEDVHDLLLPEIGWEYLTY